MIALDTPSPGQRLRRRVAGWALLASAPVNAVGVTALLAMFVAFSIGERSSGMTLGRTNDILGLIGTALMMPAVLEIHAVTGPDRRALRTSLAVVGLGAMAAIIWLQYLLINDRITFEAQLPMVSLAYLGIGVWFLGGGWVATRAGVLAHGMRLGAAGALYVGQPWWAYRWGRVLLASAGGSGGSGISRATATPDRPVASA
jgi:hypothetical protein